MLAWIARFGSTLNAMHRAARGAAIGEYHTVAVSQRAFQPGKKMLGKRGAYPGM
jgi:hypothetical protein